MFYSSCLAMVINMVATQGMFADEKANALIHCYSGNVNLPVEANYDARVLDVVEQMDFDVDTDSSAYLFESHLFELRLRLEELEK